MGKETDNIYPLTHLVIHITLGPLHKKSMGVSMVSHVYATTPFSMRLE